MLRCFQVPRFWVLWEQKKKRTEVLGHSLPNLKTKHIPKLFDNIECDIEKLAMIRMYIFPYMPILIIVFHWCWAFSLAYLLTSFVTSCIQINLPETGCIQLSNVQNKLYPTWKGENKLYWTYFRANSPTSCLQLILLKIVECIFSRQSIYTLPPASSQNIRKFVGKLIFCGIFL